MAEQRNQDRDAGRRSAVSSPGAVHGIEKGWTVVDAVGRPIGNVTDVDVDSGEIAVDGRPAGFMPFTIPMTMIRTAGDGDVHLTKILEARTSASDEVPRFTDAAKEPLQDTAREPERLITTTTTTGEPERLTTPSRTTTTSQARVRVAPPHTEAIGTAATTPTDPRVTPEAGVQQAADTTWRTGRTVIGGLALAGVAAGGYLLRKRMRRRSRFERLMDASSGYAYQAAEFARDRNPAWWGGIAAAALPLAGYYVRSMQAKPMTRSEQAANYLDYQVDQLARWLPVAGATAGTALAHGARRLQYGASHLELPHDWSRPSRWTPSTEATLSLALVAVSALAIFLARQDPRTSHRTTIADVMTRRPHTIHPNTTVADAAALMRRMDVGAVPVCDGTRLVGMVTDRDIAIRSTAEGRDPHLTPVRDILSSGVVWATDTDPVEEAARIMREHQIRRLPIVDERHSLVGIVSLGDLAVDANDRDMSGKTLETISEPAQPTR